MTAIFNRQWHQSYTETNNRTATLRSISFYLATDAQTTAGAKNDANAVLPAQIITEVDVEQAFNWTTSLSAPLRWQKSSETLLLVFLHTSFLKTQVDSPQCYHSMEDYQGLLLADDRHFLSRPEPARSLLPLRSSSNTIVSVSPRFRAVFLERHTSIPRL